MAEFIKEWGPAIVIAIVFIVIIAIVQSDFIKSTVANGLAELLNTFSNRASISMDSITTDGSYE